MFPQPTSPPTGARSSVPTTLPIQPWRPRRAHQAGFSLIELMLGVCMLAVLAGIAVATFGKTEEATRRIAVEGDANMLNKALMSYQAAGGSLDGIADPAAVLAKLKTKSLQAQEQQIAGMHGPFVDLRLEFIPATSPHELSLSYDEATHRFMLRPDRSGLVVHTNETLAHAPIVEESRDPTLALASASPWVWDYATAAPAAIRAAPTRPTTSEVAMAQNTEIPAGTVTPLRLNPPEYSQLGYEMGPSDLPQLITLTNVNPAGASELYYRINGGPYTKYTEGISLPVQEISKLETYATPLKQNWSPSLTSSEIYTFKPGQLAAPTIAVTSSTSPVGTLQTSFTLQDPNLERTAVLQYKLGEGNWVTYTAPVPLTPETSLELSVRAVAVDSQLWLASSTALTILAPPPQLLAAAIFLLPAGLYAALTYPLTVGLTNPNPSGSSRLQYRAAGGSWLDYSTVISIPSTQLDRTLEARAIPVDERRWITSPLASSRYQLTKSPLLPPVPTPPAGYYPYTSFPTQFTLQNPNPANSSELWYRFGTTGAYLKYDPLHPPTLSKEVYQTTVMTYTRSLQAEQYTDSIVRTEIYETIYFVGATQGAFHDPLPDAGSTLKKMVTNLPAPKEGNLFKWGSTEGTGLSQSTLQFDGTPAFKTSPDEWFFLGKLTYYNGSIVSGTGASSINLKFSFNISKPTNTPTTVDYTFKLINTPNTGTQAESADYVYLPTLGVPFSTTVGGRKFKLDVRFGETTADGFGTVSEYHVYELKSATGSLYGRIVEVP